jgi:hypothetical protein
MPNHRGRTLPVLVGVFLLAGVASGNGKEYAATIVGVDVPKKVIRLKLNGKDPEDFVFQNPNEQVEIDGKPGSLRLLKAGMTGTLIHRPTPDIPYKLVVNTPAAAKGKDPAAVPGGAAGSSVAQPEKKDRPRPITSVKVAEVTAEGLGKDEKEARSSALRDAVARVVGTLVDAETLVKDDKVIREKVIEFSAGFVKTYDVIKSEKTDGGLVRVQIRATVEQLQLAKRLADAKVATRDVRGEDLLAEKLTKEEARKNATALLAKLYADLPKMLYATSQGQPRLTPARDGVEVDVVVSVDRNEYAKFVRRATALFDKIATQKQLKLQVGGTAAAAPVTKKKIGPGTQAPKERVRLPDVPIQDPAAPNGYAVWIMTDMNFESGAMLWNVYWVDADAALSLGPLLGESCLHTRLTEDDGRVIHENVLHLNPARGLTAGSLVPTKGPRSRSVTREPGLSAGQWLLWHNVVATNRVRPVGPKQPVPGSSNHNVLYIAPLVMKLSPYIDYQFSVDLKRSITLTDAELESFKKVQTSVEVHAR